MESLRQSRIDQLREESCFWKRENIQRLVAAEGSLEEGDGTEHRLWCSVALHGVDLESANILAEGMGTLLPSGARYYGVLEHHVDGVVGVHELLHACVFLLVGFSEPSSVASLRGEVMRFVTWMSPTAKAVVTGCADHLFGGDPAFLAVMHWVLPRLEFVGAANQVKSSLGRRRLLFGHESVLSVVLSQFGSAVHALANEMVRSGDVSDGSRLLDATAGGFTPSVWGSSELGGDTIYVASSAVA